MQKLKCQKVTRDAIIANAIDNIVGSVKEGNSSDLEKVMKGLGLSEDQAKLAIKITKEVFS